MSAGELLRSNALDPAPLFNDHDDLVREKLFEDLEFLEDLLKP